MKLFDHDKLDVYDSGRDLLLRVVYMLVQLIRREPQSGRGRGTGTGTEEGASRSSP